jgi:hypothetical protein
LHHESRQGALKPLSACLTETCQKATIGSLS